MNFEPTYSKSVPRWRDFNQSYKPYIESLLEIDDNDYMILGKKHAIKAGSQKCQCAQILKCRYSFFDNPLTLSLANNLWPKQQYINKIALLSKYGKTSSTEFTQTKYQNIPLISTIKIVVHFDVKTRRPIPICEKRKQFIDKATNMINDEFMKEFKDKNIRANNGMQKIKYILENNNNILFEDKTELTVLDLDFNNHVSATIYGRKIDLALMRYLDDYYKGNLCIKEIGLIYVSEMKVNRNMKSKCNVKIYLNEIDKSKNQTVIGVMEQENKICCQFGIVLCPCNLVNISKM